MQNEELLGLYRNLFSTQEDLKRTQRKHNDFVVESERKEKFLQEEIERMFKVQDELIARKINLQVEINELTLKLNTATNLLESYKVRTEDSDKKKLLSVFIPHVFSCETDEKITDVNSKERDIRLTVNSKHGDIIFSFDQNGKFIGLSR
jgi:hypothetical protein